MKIYSKQKLCKTIKDCFNQEQTLCVTFWLGCFQEKVPEIAEFHNENIDYGS